MRISVVVPVYNEEENIQPLVEELAALRDTVPDWEVILVDDGSTDRTWPRIRECAESNPGLIGIRSPENRGQTAALLLGLREVTAEVVVTMDGDLQNDPSDIPRLLGELDGFDVVCGYRAQRRDTWSRRAGSRVANLVRNCITHDGVRDTGCTLKAFRSCCIDDLPPLTGAHRFMPAYFKLSGRRIKEIPVTHRARRHGTSKYTNLSRLPRGLLDLLGFWWYRKRYLPPLTPERTRHR